MGFATTSVGPAFGGGAVVLEGNEVVVGDGESISSEELSSGTGGSMGASCLGRRRR